LDRSARRWQTAHTRSLPGGIVAPCNFLKHAKAWGPSALRRVRIQEKRKLVSTSSRTHRGGRLSRADGNRRNPHLEFD
jgi:hypothetical protein